MPPRLKPPRTSSSALAKSANPQPESQRGEKEEDDLPAFLRSGTEALNAVKLQSFEAAKAIFDHTKPGDLTFNPNADMTTLTGAQVSQAYQYFTGLHAYAICEVAKCDAEMTAIDFQMKVLAKGLTVEHGGDKKKKYDLDAMIATNADYLKMSEKKAEFTVRRIAFEATTKGLEQKAACLSRELTRREYEARVSGKR